jgi:hypothetical protein
VASNPSARLLSPADRDSIRTQQLHVLQSIAPSNSAPTQKPLKHRTPRPQKRGFLQLGVSAWFGSDVQWKRVLVSVHGRHLLVFADQLEACTHSILVDRVISLLAAPDRRSFELAVAPIASPSAAADAGETAASLFSAVQLAIGATTTASQQAATAPAPAVPPSSSSSSSSSPANLSPSAPAAANAVFRFRCDGEEELREWTSVIELWRDHWASKAARQNVISDLLSRLDDAAVDGDGALRRGRSVSSPSGGGAGGGGGGGGGPVVINDGAVQDLNQEALDARTLSLQIVALVHALDANDGGSLSMSSIASTVRKLTQHFEHEQSQMRERLQQMERERNFAQMREQKMQDALKEVACENIALKEQLAQSERNARDAVCARDDALAALVEAKMAAADHELTQFRKRSQA